MSNLVAKTNIRHGEEDGSVTEVAYGESVEDLPQNVIDYLVAEGLAVPGDATEGGVNNDNVKNVENAANVENAGDSAETGKEDSAEEENKEEKVEE